MKNKQERLLFEMIIFFFIIVLCFGLIIINEKKGSLKEKKISNKIDDYIGEKYKNIKDEIIVNDIRKDNNKYIKRITNKENKHLYFDIIYEDSKITSTYKEDYETGNTLIKFLEEELNKELKKNNINSYYSNLSITLDIKLNEVTDIIRKRLLKNKTEYLYTINYETNIVFNALNINNLLINLNDYVNSISLNPKGYNVIISDISNITNSIKLGVKSDIINNVDIGTIIINNNSDIMNKYNIKVKYLN